MQLPEEVTADVRVRLRRVAGQVLGVERMLGEGRECDEVVAQLAAATKALGHAAFLLAATGLTYCAEHRDQGPGSQDVASARKMFMKLV